MKITENEYKEALERVVEYEKQISVSDTGTECYIMQRMTDHIIFVTTNEAFANRCYDTGDYVMRTAMLYE